MLMGVLRDTILVSVATLGVGSAFMEIDSKNATFNKVFPYIGTFLSAGIGYYFLRQSKLIKAGEFQPDQELSDYSLNDLATSSAIEGFEPFKYSVVGNRAEGLETKKEEPVEYEDPLESWREEYDAESVLKEKPSMNFTWKKFSDWEIEPTMQKIKDMTKKEMIVPYPFGVERHGRLKNQNIKLDDPSLIFPYSQNLKQYMEVVSLSGYLKYGDATFYLLQTNMKVLKEKVKRGDSNFKNENSYLVYCEHDGKMNLVCGASYPIQQDKVYSRAAIITPDVPTIRQGFVVGRKEATQYAEDYLYFHLLKPELEYSFDESFEIEFGERKQEDYQNMIIPLKYKRKIKGKTVPFTNYYYTNHRGELDFLFAIGEFGSKLAFYCDMGWQFGTYNTPDSNYPMPKLSWSKNYGVERLAKIFAERPIIQMWVKSITLDSDNLKTRRINMFNDDKQAWFDQQFKPMLVANYSPLILTGMEHPRVNVYEEFMKRTIKRLEANNAYSAKKDLGFPVDSNPLPYFKQDISYYDFISSVYRQNDRENPLLYQRPGYPLTPLYNRFVNRRNPYGFSHTRTYYTIQGKMTFNLDNVKENLNLLSVPQPPVGWYKRMRTEMNLERTDFGRIASSILTIGVYLNNSIYHPPISIIPFEINDTKNQYVKAFRLLYSRALRENQIADPQTIFEDRLKWSLYSLDEDALMELDRSNDEAKKVVEDYYKQLDDMILEELGGYGFKHHSVRKAESFESESTSKIHSVEISRSSNPEKKLMAIFSDKEGNKVKTTHFGQRGASDYTKHGDKERMLRYLERHGGGTTTSTKEDWKDPTTAGSLSRWVLWNKPSLSGSFADYKRRFGLKGSLNVSKSSEGLETKNAETFEATEWVGFCPECNKWRTKDMSLLFKNNTNRSDEDYIIDLSFNGWSVPKKLLNKRLCGKSKQYGDIQRTTDSWSGYGQRTYSNSVCGTPLTKVKSKYKAEWEGNWAKYERIVNRLNEAGFTIDKEIKGEKGYSDTWKFKPEIVIPLSGEDIANLKYRFVVEDVGGEGEDGEREFFLYLSLFTDITDSSILDWNEEQRNFFEKEIYDLLKEKGIIKSDYWYDEYGFNSALNMQYSPEIIYINDFEKECSHENLSIKTMEVLNGELLLTLDCDNCGKRTSTSASLNQGWDAEFEAKSPAQKSLDKWTKEDWGTKSGKPSTQGEEATGERYLPAKAREALTDEEYARTTAKKRRDTKAGKQFSPQPDDIEEKVKKYRDAEENRMIDIEDFNKVADAIQASNQPATVLLAPSSYHKGQNHITIVVGMDAPHSVTNAMFSVMKDLGYHPQYFSIVGNTTTLSRNEYSQIRRLNGGHKNYRSETFEAIEGKGSNARFTDQPDPKVYRDPALRQKARNKFLKGNKGGEEGEWSARKAQMSATEYRKLYENKYGEGKNPYF